MYGVPADSATDHQLLPMEWVVDFAAKIEAWESREIKVT